MTKKKFEKKQIENWISVPNYRFLIVCFFKLQSVRILQQHKYPNSCWWILNNIFTISLPFSSSLFIFCIRTSAYSIQGYKSTQRTGYTCCDLCGKVYSNGGVSRHKRYYCPYTQKAPYIYCYLCPFSSRRPDNFRTHMRVKHQVIQ